jgi:hypothetical protein
MVQLAPGAKEPGTLHVVVIGNSPGFELVIAVSSMATAPVLVNVMTAPVNDVLPTAVLGNEKLSGLSAICDKVVGTPAPDTATETLPALVVLKVI